MLNCKPKFGLEFHRDTCKHLVTIFKGGQDFSKKKSQVFFTFLMVSGFKASH